MGRITGIFRTWEECQAFPTLQEAEEYLVGRRAKQCYVNWKSPGKEVARAQPASFVAGRALRATVKVLQEEETHPIRVQSCLDSGSDVNLASRGMLHDVHPIVCEEIANCGDSTEFTGEGTLWVFTSGAAHRIPALVATKAQLPFGCEVLLGVPVVDDLGVKLDE